MPKTFNHKCAAGITAYKVLRRHRDAGYFVCAAINGNQVGAIEIFSRDQITSA